MLKSNLVVTYEVGNRDILVLLIHGVLLSLCSRVDVRRFHFFLVFVCCCVLRVFDEQYVSWQSKCSNGSSSILILLVHGVLLS
jgi:hypothetical protein